ncbi:MAG: SDR family oxidoreductase [Promethearchaeota archaeon]
MEKVLIIGANGFLGRKLLSRFKTTHKVYGADIKLNGILPQFNPILIDITDEKAVLDLFSDIQPDLTILTAAITNVDLCEDNPEVVRKVNSEGPLFVARAVKSIKGRMIHISTDFIFDGTTGDYVETDHPNPKGIYAQTKRDGERNVVNTDIPSVICRSSILHGWPDADQPDNFFSWAYKQLKQKKTLTIIDGQITTPTLVDDLVEFLFGVSDFQKSEIYHTSGPEPISKYKFITKLAEVFQFDLALVQKVSSFAQKAPRPENSSLNTQKIQKLGIHSFKAISESFQFLNEQINSKKNE